MFVTSGPLTPADDDALLAQLRRVVHLVDPMPEAVQIAALTALEWHTLDAEPAALVHDSAVEEAALAARVLTFAAAGLTIEVEAEVTGQAGCLCLVGQLLPPQPADITIRHGDELAAVRADARGRFVAHGVAPGR